MKWEDAKKVRIGDVLAPRWSKYGLPVNGIIRQGSTIIFYFYDIQYDFGIDYKYVRRVEDNMRLDGGG